MTTTNEQPANWYFSFGHGQENFNKYVKIYGTMSGTRDEMFKLFGREWSMQYTEEKALTAIRDWNWTELE